MHSHLHVAAVCWIIVTTLSSRANCQAVHVVPSGGDVNAAIAASSLGDVVVLASSGSYAGFTLDGKGLSVVCDGAAAYIYGAVEVKNLPANQSATLRGLSVNWYGVGVPPLQLNSNSGSVWIEEILAYGDGYDIYLAAGAVIDHCASVYVRGCHLEGAAGYFTGTPYSIDGRPGLIVDASNISMSDSQCVGGDGGPVGNSGCSVSGGGGGAIVSNCTFFASHSTFRGGNGGKKSICPNQGPGGTGFTSSNAQVTTLECSFIGGVVGGSGISGPLVRLAGSARSFFSSSPVREQQTVTLTFGGLPAEQTGFLYSGNPCAPALFTDYAGTLLIDPATAEGLLTGPIANDGTLVVSLSAPNLPPSVQGFSYYLQSVFFDLTAGYAVLGPASSLVVLDSAF